MLPQALFAGNRTWCPIRFPQPCRADNPGPAGYMVPISCMPSPACVPPGGLPGPGEKPACKGPHPRNGCCRFPASDRSDFRAIMNLNGGVGGRKGTKQYNDFAQLCLQEHNKGRAANRREGRGEQGRGRPAYGAKKKALRSMRKAFCFLGVPKGI